MHDEAVGGGAGLADVAELGDHRAVDSFIEVGVFEHHKRGVSAKLHRGAEHVVGGLFEQRLANTGGAGEAELAEARVGDDRRRDVARGGGRQDVNDSGGHSRVFEQLDEVERGEGGEFGGLDDRGAPGGERRRNLAGGHRQREVPRSDQEGGSDGEVGDDHPPGAFGVGAVAAGDSHGLFAEPAQKLPAVGDFTAGFGERLAHFKSHQEGKIFGTLLEEIKGTAQDNAACTRSRLGPRGLRSSSSVHGPCTVGDRGIRDRLQDKTGCRVTHRDCSSRSGIDPLATDVELVGNAAEQRCF